ncbi:efflux RND transporter permease subunit [Tabrizicola sp.]|jgi:multidrug efflux pump subunit AcrB|uniref:efflux RND transporter permease subunit n=1 Tax=Tabrizicola sp. TaxID=2005166 RepID=UPI001A439FC7|nr:efflux RND transporter permease subunit [Tabrizicola sp.]MBL9064192.1 efflux RND transporter permease subunit [Tabrizicola sp.]
MNFSAWSIRNPVAPLLAFFLLLILGWQSFNALPITRFPNIDVPLVAVSVAQSGAAPAEMESQVTKEIEDAVAGLTGAKRVTSTVTDGLSTTVIEFRMEVPTDKAVQDVKDAVDQIRGDLPGGIESPIVTRIDVEGQAIMTFAVHAPDMTMEEISWFVDDTVTRALQGKPGIGRVTRIGGADREIRVELDPVKLDSYGVTAQAISAQIAATNTNLGAGKVKLGTGEQVIRTLGDQGTVDSLANTTIALPSGRFVKLTDLGQVIDSYEELKSFARIDGEASVSFLVFRSKGASEVSVAEVTNQVVEELRQQNPNVSITMVDDSVFYTYGNYESALHTLLEGGLLAILVVLAFLRNWRATLISAVALPLSAIPTFWLMSQLGFSLNLVSFLALTLATGILVDDAIVEIENIARHIRMGKTPYRAAIEAADEIGLAVIATTSTIIAVFVPVSFMPGIPGQYFRQFGLTVAIAVFFSLLVARLITPMMAAYFMRAKDAVGHEEGHADGAFMRAYMRVVKSTTKVRRWKKHPRIALPTYYITLVVAVIVVIISVIAMLQVPGSLFPPEDESRIVVSVELPPGSTLDDTAATTDAMREVVKDIDGVDSVLVIGGSTPLGDRDIRRATFTIILDRLDNGLERKLIDLGRALPLVGNLIPEIPSEGRLRPQVEIEADVFQALKAVPDVRAFKVSTMGGGGSRPFAYDILSTDEQALDTAVRKIEEALRDEPMFLNPSTEAALPRPEIQITPKADEAARLGVTVQQIATVVRVATIGDVSAALGKLSIDNRLVPIRVQLDEVSRDDLARIAALKVMTTAGPVPLSAVATVEVGEGPSVVKRLSRQRVATLGADIAPGKVLDQVTARFNEILPTLHLPATVKVAPSGDAEVQAELLVSFQNAMILGVLLMMFVLILLFHSVLQPITIIFSLLLSVGGVATALIVTQNPLSMPVLIGILMLMGIVAKNAILLIDFAIEMRDRGMSRIEAVVEAGHKRAQPIVMTSIAMSAGMLPSALGVGEGGAFRAPMAIAVMGGIIVSTVLSLVVVPSMYLAMDDLSRFFSWVLGRFIGKKEVEPKVPDPLVLADSMARNQIDVALLQGRISLLEETLARRTPKPHAAE